MRRFIPYLVAVVLLALAYFHPEGLLICGAAPCLKVILNGARVASNTDILVDQVREYEETISEEYALMMVAELNEAEDCVDRATRLFLESQNFSGPYPHSLDFKTKG